MQKLLDLSDTSLLARYKPDVNEDVVHWTEDSDSESTSEDGEMSDCQYDDTASYTDVEEDPGDKESASEICRDPADSLAAYTLAKTFFRDFLHDLRAEYTKGNRRVHFRCTDKFRRYEDGLTTTIVTTLNRLVGNSIYPGGLRPEFGHNFGSSMEQWTTACPNASENALKTSIPFGDVMMVVLESHIVLT